MKLPLLSGRQVVKTLERSGFVETHRKGSHVKMKHSDGRLIVFPYHDVRSSISEQFLTIKITQEFTK
jgi:predicted RNA binding protein YcfA (HicA-like mRNA interferase family)